MVEERSRVIWATVIGYIHPTLARILGYDPEHPDILNEPADCISGMPGIPKILNEYNIVRFSETLRKAMKSLGREKASEMLEQAYWFRAVGDDENEIDETFVQGLCDYKVKSFTKVKFDDEMASLINDVVDDIKQALTRIVETCDYDDGVSSPHEKLDEYSISCPMCKSKMLRFTTEEYVMGDKVRHYQCGGQCGSRFTVVYGKTLPAETEPDKVPTEDGEYDEDLSDDENVERLIQHFVGCLDHQPTYDIITWEDFLEGAKEQGFAAEFVDTFEDDLRKGWKEALEEYMDSKG